MVRNIYAVLRNCLNTAVRLRMIATNPCAGRSVKLPRSTREEMLFLTPTEIVALADEISRDLEVLSEFALLHDVSSWRGTSFRVAARAFGATIDGTIVG